MTPAVYRDAARLQTSMLSAAEKKLLVAVARRLPAWISSDHLTALGAAAMLGTGIAYAMSAWHQWVLYLVPIGLGLNWFGDSLDGTVARVRNCQRPRYGFYLDHVLDSAGMACLFVGLAFSGYMTPIVAVGVIAAYFLLNIEIYLATVVLREFRMAFFKLGPTELRLVMVAGTAALFEHARVEIAGRKFLLWDVGGVVTIAGLLAIFLIAAMRTARTLYREEPIAAPGARIAA